MGTARSRPRRLRSNICQPLAPLNRGLTAGMCPAESCTGAGKQPHRHIPMNPVEVGYPQVLFSGAFPGPVWQQSLRQCLKSLIEANANRQACWRSPPLPPRPKGRASSACTMRPCEVTARLLHRGKVPAASQIWKLTRPIQHDSKTYIQCPCPGCSLPSCVQCVVVGAADMLGGNGQHQPQPDHQISKSALFHKHCAFPVLAVRDWNHRQHLARTCGGPCKAPWSHRS